MRISTTLSMLVLAALMSSCAARVVPSTWPKNSAASTSAPEGQASHVTLALDEDPPLPENFDSSQRWRGLRTSTVSAVYVCPMHPDVSARQPGQCPRCGMNLVPKR